MYPKPYSIFLRGTIERKLLHCNLHTVRREEAEASDRRRKLQNPDQRLNFAWDCQGV